MSDQTFTLHYLGCSSLSKGTTGLGLIQKPLKEHYFNFHKKLTKSPTEVYMQLTYNGLNILTPTGATSGTYLKNTHYEFNMINYMEAVQFTINKTNSRKTQYAFMPLNEKRIIRSPDKLFSTLEKKNNYLLKILHQPIIVCLLRRQAGLKALDCHVFLSLSNADAMRIVENFNLMQQQSMQKEYIGDFGVASQNAYSKDHKTNKDNYHPHPASTENLAGGPRNARPSAEYPGHNPTEGYQLRDEYFRHQAHTDWPAATGSDRYADAQNQHQYRQPQPYNQQPAFPAPSSHQNSPVLLSRESSYHDKPPVNQEGQPGYPRHQGNNQGYALNYRPSMNNGGRLSNYDDRQRLSQVEQLNPMAQRTNDSNSYSSNVSNSQKYPPDQLSQSGPAFSLSNLESRQQFDRRNNTGQAFETAHTKPVAKVPPHKIAGVKVLPTAFELPKRPLSPKPPYQESDTNLKPVSSDQSNSDMAYVQYRHSSPENWNRADVQYRHNNYDNKILNSNNSNNNNRYSNVYAYDSKTPGESSGNNYPRSSLAVNDHARPLSMASANDYYKHAVPSMSQNDIYRQYQNSHYPPQHPSPNYNPGVAERQYNRDDMATASGAGSRGGSGQEQQDRYSQSQNDAHRRQPQQQQHYGYKQIAASNPQLNVGNKEAEIASMFQNMGIDRPPVQPAYSRQGNMNFEKSLGYYP